MTSIAFRIGVNFHSITLSVFHVNEVRFPFPQARRFEKVSSPVLVTQPIPKRVVGSEDLAAPVAASQFAHASAAAVLTLASSAPSSNVDSSVQESSSALDGSSLNGGVSRQPSAKSSKGPSRPPSARSSPQESQLSSQHLPSAPAISRQLSANPSVLSSQAESSRQVFGFVKSSEGVSDLLCSSRGPESGASSVVEKGAEDIGAMSSAPQSSAKSSPHLAGSRKSCLSVTPKEDEEGTQYHIRRAILEAGLKQEVSGADGLADGPADQREGAACPSADPRPGDHQGMEVVETPRYSAGGGPAVVEEEAPKDEADEKNAVASPEAEPPRKKSVFGGGAARVRSRQPSADRRGDTAGSPAEVVTLAQALARGRKASTARQVAENNESVPAPAPQSGPGEVDQRAPSSKTAVPTGLAHSPAGGPSPVDSSPVGCSPKGESAAPAVIIPLEQKSAASSSAAPGGPAQDQSSSLPKSSVLPPYPSLSNQPASSLFANDSRFNNSASSLFKSSHVPPTFGATVVTNVPVSTTQLLRAPPEHQQKAPDIDKLSAQASPADGSADGSVYQSAAPSVFSKDTSASSYATVAGSL